MGSSKERSVCADLFSLSEQHRAAMLPAARIARKPRRLLPYEKSVENF
jgi:hypothetical protein